jgi:hypothetical protein
MATTDRFSLRNIYLYLVCFVTLLIAIFAAVNLVRSTVELAYPDPYYYGPVIERDGGIDPAEQERQERAARDSQRRNAILGLVTSGTFLLIAVPVYGYHWRRIQDERPTGRRAGAGGAAGSGGGGAPGDAGGPEEGS